jgi:hypothetical protein
VTYRMTKTLPNLQTAARGARAAPAQMTPPPAQLRRRVVRFWLPTCK